MFIINYKSVNAKLSILGLILYAISSIALAGVEQDNFPKHVDSSITQDRAARALARVADGNGAAEVKAYHEIRSGEKAKSPSMTYALALFYLSKWQSGNHGLSPNPLFNDAVKKLNATSPGFNRDLMKYTLKSSASDRIYDKYLHYLVIAAKLGDPTAEADLGYEYFWEPQRVLAFILYASYKNHGDASGALRDFITSQYMGKAWALMLNKSWRLEDSAAQRGSPSALFDLKMGRTMLTGKLMASNYTAIDHYAPYLMNSIHSYVINSEIGTFKKSAEFGNVHSTTLMLCKSYFDGGNTTKWFNELHIESLSSYKANEIVKLVDKNRGVIRFCSKQ